MATETKGNQDPGKSVVTRENSTGRHCQDHGDVGQGKSKNQSTRRVPQSVEAPPRSQGLFVNLHLLAPSSPFSKFVQSPVIKFS